MRLVDADELWKYKFKSASEKMDLDVVYMGGWNDAIDSIVENAPIVDAELIRHGRWLWVDGVRCSVCNYKLQTTGLPSYCPHCGAKMETTK